MGSLVMRRKSGVTSVSTLLTVKRLQRREGSKAVTSTTGKSRLTYASTFVNRGTKFSFFMTISHDLTQVFASHFCEFAKGFHLNDVPAGLRHQPIWPFFSLTDIHLPAP